jgi:hypothetical protein
VKILYTYFDSSNVARHAVVVGPSTMPRKVRQNTHRTSQALANTDNYKYTWIYLYYRRHGDDISSRLELPRKLRTEAASQA